MARVTGRMKAPKPGAASFNPSIADSTEIAGVITPSPYNSAAPRMPRIIGRVMRRQDQLDVFDGYHQHECPEDERDDADGVGRGWDRMAGGIQCDGEGVERAGA